MCVCVFLWVLLGVNLARNESCSCFAESYCQVSGAVTADGHVFQPPQLFKSLIIQFFFVCQEFILPMLCIVCIQLFFAIGVITLM